MKQMLLVGTLFILSPQLYAAEVEWTGSYVGAQLGYADADSDAKVSVLGGDWSTESASTRNAASNASKTRQNDRDWTIGLQAGYDFQFANHLVLGIGAELTRLNLEDKSTRQASSGVLSYTVTNSMDVKSRFALKPRLGYAIDNLLLYVTAGIAWSRVEFESLLQSNGGYRKAGSDNDTMTSTLFGAGVEYKLNQNISAKVEYLQTNSESNRFNTAYLPGSTFAPPSANYSEQYKHDLDYQTITIGLNYRF